MPWAPPYVTADSLKAALGITSAAHNDEIDLAIAAASRAIDRFTGRQFGKDDLPTTRYFPARLRPPTATGPVEVDDLASLEDLVVGLDASGDGTFSTTLASEATSNGYRLGPFNAEIGGEPWTEVYPLGVRWPARPRVLRMTATFGWPEVPDLVKQATFTEAMRLFKRKDAPFGVAGSPEIGSEIRLLARLDPDVEFLLSGLRRRWLVRGTVGASR